MKSSRDSVEKKHPQGYVSKHSLPRCQIPGERTLNQGSGGGDKRKEMLTQLSDRNFFDPFVSLDYKIKSWGLNLIWI